MSCKRENCSMKTALRRVVSESHEIRKYRKTFLMDRLRNNEFKWITQSTGISKRLLLYTLNFYR